MKKRVGGTSFTYAVWIHPITYGGTGSANYPGIVEKGTAAATDYVLALYTVDSYKPYFQVFSSGDNQIAKFGSACTVGEWSLIVAWFDVSDNKAYIQVNDGTPVASPALTGTVRDSANDWELGSRSGVVNTYFDGTIEEVGFWKRILTADERTYLYNAGVGRTYSGGIVI